MSDMAVTGNPPETAARSMTRGSVLVDDSTQLRLGDQRARVVFHACDPARHLLVCALARVAGAQTDALHDCDLWYFGRTNAILGTLMLVIFAVIIVSIVGFGTGIWLSSYASEKPRELVRLLTDVLAGVLSVVVGYFGYILLVKIAGWQFSLAGGAIALTIIMLPYVVRGTDLALESVPRELREGGFALGATYTTVLMTVSWPYALPSVFTMLLLATGIALGETAPLIYTAGWSNYLPTTHLTHSPVPYLTYVIWTFISQPFAESHALAFAAAALLMLMIVVTNVFARSWLERYSLANNAASGNRKDGHAARRLPRSSRGG